MKAAPESAATEFPARIPIKIIGHSEPCFELRLLEVFDYHVPGFDATSVQRRPSSNGKYTALTVVIVAQSLEQLAAIYSDIKQCPGFVMAL